MGSFGQTAAGLTSLINDTKFDAYSRLRVSEPRTIFNSKQIFDNQPLFWDDAEVSGSGTTSTYTKVEASTKIGVTLNTAGVRARQTYMSFNYQVGKSQLIFLSGVLNSSGGGSGIKSCLGIYNDNNGVFFCDDEGTLKVVIRSSTSGSPVDSEVSQSSWNLDKLDGTGKSNLTLDKTKSQVFVIDFQWLAVGRVRLGFMFSGEIVYCHEFLNSNTTTGAYMSTPNLPLRYEIENDGTGATSTMDSISSSVISEGGQDSNGNMRHNSNGSTVINANTVGTKYVILGLRLKTTGTGSTISLEGISLLNSTNDDFEWFIILNPTVATPVTFNDQTNSTVQFAVGNAGNPSTSTVTGGTIIEGGYVKSSSSSGEINSALLKENLLRLGTSINGTRDELYLCVSPLAINADIYGGLTWREET